MMIEKIAGHVADFSPSLQSNTKALYKYCPIALITLVMGLWVWCGVGVGFGGATMGLHDVMLLSLI